MTIDANHRPMGRLASEIAHIIQGKHRADYSPEKCSRFRVIVHNVDRMILTGKKMEAKLKFRHTGYPGGLKIRSVKNLFRLSPEKLLLHAIERMLPANKLRRKRLKNVEFNRQQKP